MLSINDVEKNKPLNYFLTFIILFILINMDVDKADLGINFEKYILIYYIYIYAKEH